MRVGLAMGDEETTVRGFALYVGTTHAKASAFGTDLPTLVTALRDRLSQLVPLAESVAAVALARPGSPGSDLTIVRLAMKDPVALEEQRHIAAARGLPSRHGVTIDLQSNLVLVDGKDVGVTKRELELLRLLVLREGRIVGRDEIKQTLWPQDGAVPEPKQRTVDVIIRRLRSKLAPYEDIVRSVRGAGYRFDRHADVTMTLPSTRSPDVF
jgi:DNA-binding response OmpR family regulator